MIETTLTLAEATPLIVEVLRAGFVPALVGPVGLGKSTTSRAIVDAIGYEHYQDIRLSYYSPTDLAGYPYKDANDHMRFARPAMFTNPLKTLYNWEEFGNAPRATANAALQIVLDNRIGDHVFPEETRHIICSNGRKDACFTERMSPALRDRLWFFELRHDAESWRRWATKAGINPLVVAYIALKPDAIYTFNPSGWDNEAGFATSRGWHHVATMLDREGVLELPSMMRGRLLSARLGIAIGSEFNAFLDHYFELPSIEEIVADPRNAPLPDEMSSRWAAAVMVSNNLTHENFSQCLTYLGRTSKMLEVFAVSTALTRNPDIMKLSPDLPKWIAANPDVFRA